MAFHKRSVFARSHLALKSFLLRRKSTASVEDRYSQRAPSPASGHFHTASSAVVSLHPGYVGVVPAVPSFTIVTVSPAIPLQVPHPAHPAHPALNLAPTVPCPTGTTFLPLLPPPSDHPTRTSALSTQDTRSHLSLAPRHMTADRNDYVKGCDAANAYIAVVEPRCQALRTEISDLQTQIAILQTTLAGKEDQIVAHQSRVEELAYDVAICRRMIRSATLQRIPEMGRVRELERRLEEDRDVLRAVGRWKWAPRWGCKAKVAELALRYGRERERGMALGGVIKELRRRARELEELVEDVGGDE